MAKLDETYPFKPLSIAVLTISDTRELATDTSGDVLAEMLTKAGHKLAERAIVTDDVTEIRAKVEEWIASDAVNVVITTGGTGLTARDVTPDAIKPLFEKEIDGFSTVFHMVSFQQVATSTIQSRACAGLANGTYVFCLPGSPGACKDGWNGILKWQLDSRHRPCNLVEIMPRLQDKAPAE